MRRAARILAPLLIAAGVLGLVWVLVVWQWQDPFTAAYTAWQQHRLKGQFDALVVEQRSLHRTLPAPVRTSDDAAARRAAVAKEVRREAAAFQRRTHPGQAIGRIVIPRIGLDMIVVDGTDESSLEHGPGLDRRTLVPGRDGLVYIAGHRTTYLAPFAHIDSIRPGDVIRIVMPYATFVYRARDHKIVPATDMAMLDPVHHELLRLQACHPRFFATHRYIVDARLVSETLRG